MVLALLELHRLGFYCPKLNGRNIAVVEEKSHFTARLWDFQVLKKGIISVVNNLLSSSTLIITTSLFCGVYFQA